MDSKNRRINRGDISRQRPKISLPFSPSIRLSQSQTKLPRNTKNIVDLNKYRIILNKLLSIKKYEQLIQYASRFIPKQILQCKSSPQQSNQQSYLFDKTCNPLGQRLLTDGIFIRHLAQCAYSYSSETLKQMQGKQCAENWKIVKNFRRKIKINRKLFKEYLNSIKPKSLSSDNESIYGETDDCESIIFQNQSKRSENIFISNRNKKQLDQQKQLRLLGFSKVKKKKQTDDQNKVRLIPFEQYVASNRKNMETSIKEIQKRLQNSQRKKQTERVSNLLGNCHSPHITNKEKSLKRHSLRQCIKIKPAFEKMTQNSLSELPIIEQQIIKLFLPAILQIGYLNSYQQLCENEHENMQEMRIKIVGDIQLLGIYHNYEIKLVGIQFFDCLNYGEAPKIVYDFAAMATPINQKQSNKKGQKDEIGKQMEINQNVRIFITH